MISHVASKASLPGSQPAFPELECGVWQVLHTRSRQEKVVAADLAAMDIAHYLPLVRQVRMHGGRRVAVEVPLFAGYVFLRGSREQAYQIDRTHRIARILPVADQQRLDWELRNLHLALTKDAPLEPYPHLRQGTRVEVKTGPFRGLQGIVSGRIGGQRLVLQVDMLGQAVSLEIDGWVLEPLE